MPHESTGLKRFEEAHVATFDRALAELRSGRIVVRLDAPPPEAYALPYVKGDPECPS